MPRTQKPDRVQFQWRETCLDRLLPNDHPARAVWALVEAAELEPFYDAVRASSGRAGRPPVDPAILIGLWAYASLDGVSSARQIADLCSADMAYVWICGEVGVNYHLLSDFRKRHGASLDGLLIAIMSVTAQHDLMPLEAWFAEARGLLPTVDDSSERNDAESNDFPPAEAWSKSAAEQLRLLNAERTSRTGANASKMRRRTRQQQITSDRQNRLETAAQRLAMITTATAQLAARGTS